MTRRIVWLTLIVVGILVLGGAWFVTNFERVPFKHRQDEEPEARRNPHLALERFLGRMGRPMKRESDARSLDAPPAGSVLMLDRNRRHHMTPERTAHLMEWVRAGGYLIVVPEYPQVSDPICDELDVGDFDAKSGDFTDMDEDEPSTDDEDESADETPSPVVAPQKGKRPPRPKTVRVDIPGAARPLQIGFWTYGREAGEIEPDWSVGDPNYGDQVLHFQVGQGHVTIVDGFMPMLNNHNIGDNDHAEFLWTLIQTYQPDASRPITLMSKFTIPSLWDWLAESAWTAVISGLALLALWLWRILPRFGPAMPEPEASRRELREHLTALGRYVWRAGGLDHWLRVAREEFLSRLALRHPAVAALSPTEQATELGRMSGRSASLIAAALHGTAASPHSFTQAMRTLRNLERVL